MNTTAAAPRENHILHGQVSIDAFEAGDLNAEMFTHEAHIFVAWAYLQTNSVLQSLEKMTKGLKRLTQKLGVPQKYHETITWFFMFLIAERCETMPAISWTEFKDWNPDLFSDAKALLSRSYTQEYLVSERARQQFILPNRVE